MIIPLGTDAPVYHRPVATVALIIVCVLTFFAVPGHSDQTWTLTIGDGIHPVQWVSNLFVHNGWFHLIGNMIFLWTFGLVVEGKVGWWKFLLIFVGLGAFESAALQLLVPKVEPFQMMGCSGVIFGLLSMCLVWAPRNEVVCLLWIRLAPMVLDISILWFAVMYLVLDVLGASLTGMVMANVTQRPMAAILAMVLDHSAGAILGFGLGVLMIKQKLVDCEHWDLFAIIEGRAGKSKNKAQRERGLKSSYSMMKWRNGEGSKKPKVVLNEEPAGPIEDPAATGLRLVREHLGLGEIEAALAVYQHYRRKLGQWRLPDRDWIALIQAAIDHKAWNEAVLVSRDYLAGVETASPRVRLKLAQILVQNMERPVQALKVLEGIAPGSLSPDLETARVKLAKKAAFLREEGVMELEDELW
jgi:membrane associated rhomboid family serine protease